MAFAAPLILGLGAGAGAGLAGGSLVTGLAVGSSVLSGLSSFQQASYQRSVAKNNAREAEYQANVSAEATQQEQLRSDREYRALLGSQTAALAASGIDTASPSSQSVLRNTRRVGREAAMDITGQGAADVRRLQQDAANFKGEARAAGAQAFNALAGMTLNVGSATAQDKRLSKSLIGAARSVRGLF